MRALYREAVDHTWRRGAENLVVAAQAAGRSALVSYDPETTGIRIALGEDWPGASPLFAAIFARQCTRTVYDASALSSSELQALESLPATVGVSISLLQTDQETRTVTDSVLEGNRAQCADPAWAAALRTWIRFDARTAVRTGDGLYRPVMGSPDVPPWLALQAAALDLRIAFINQPVGVHTLRAESARYFGIGDRRPDLVIRIGHGPLGVRSLRRPPAEVLVSASAERVT